MKKVLKTLALTGSMLAVAASAYATDTAQVTLTSPAIVKSGCEKVGSVTFSLDAGTVIKGGDWMYMDLPANTSICNTIDYVIGTGRTPANLAHTITIPTSPAIDATLAVGITGIPAFAAAGVNGPVSATDISGINGTTTINPNGATAQSTAWWVDANTNLTIDAGECVLPAGATAITETDTTVPADGVFDTCTATGGTVALRVYAPQGGRRVWVYVYGTGVGTANQYGVDAGTNFNLTILDGQAYNSAAATVGIWMDKADTTNAQVSKVYGDGIYDDIGLTNGAANGANVPHVENTLCVDAEQMSGDLMFTSFASLNDFLTFTGDSQIAHVAAANTITLQGCGGKTSFPLEGNIEIGSQGNCIFDYEVIGSFNEPTGYCDYNASYNTFIGNKLLIVGSTTFGDPGDRYDMTVSVDTNGVYFASNAVTVGGFTPSQTTDTDCTSIAAGTAVGATFNVGNTGITTWNAGTCSVSTAARVTELTTGSVGNITGIDTYDTLWVDFPSMVYDTSIIGNGTEVDVSLSLDKYPCGTIFNASRTIGTFVTTCPVNLSGGTTLLYPFMVPFDGVSAGSWWGGFTVVNASTASGTCDLAMTEDDGDTASYTTPSIAANGGQWNAGALASLLAMVTPGASNAGTFGDANVSIIATCDFSMAGGFAFIGNDYGVGEGTGYTAYALDVNNIWQ